MSAPLDIFRRKAVLIVALLIALAAIVGVIAYLTQREALTEGGRVDEFGTRLKYKVERYRYRDRVLLTLSTDSGSTLTFDLSPMTIDKIIEQRWLANGRSIYLSLMLKPDRGTAASPARIIYDFHRGEIYASSPLNLWRTQSSSARWMNDAEFDGLLARFGQ